MQIYDIDLIKLLPIFMRKDKFNICLATYLNLIIQKHSGNLNKLSIWNAIDELNEKECDMLAWELNLDYYSKKDTLERKRFNIKTGIQFKMNACTKSTIEKALYEYSGYSGEIYLNEWFDNNRQFNHYTITLNNPGIYNAVQMINVIKSIGRKSAILDNITVHINRDMTYFIGTHIIKSSKKVIDIKSEFTANWYTYEGKYLTDENGTILLEG